MKRAIIEASRTLAKVRFVAIYDFDSSDEVEKKYEHLEPLTSYRWAYVPLMELHGFILISKNPLSHSGGSDVARWDSKSMERIALRIFTK